MRQRYNFDRYVWGKLMAEGIAVHASDLAEAHVKAMDLRYPDERDRVTTLSFTDNAPCPAALDCGICHPAIAS